jgi:hypothetical protein
MNSQTLSNKSRKELNGSLMKLYRQLTYHTDPPPEKEDQKTPPAVHEEGEVEDTQEIESEISPAIGIGI